MPHANAYQRFVSVYLTSEQGRDTPDSVACALLRLDVELCGFDRHPSVERLHEFRVLLQDIHAYAAAADELEASGVIPAAMLEQARSEAG